MALDFIQNLKKMNVKYVIVSGYVAILTGRSRSTEDIDVIIEKLSRNKTEGLVENLQNAGYWCINAETSGVYEMLNEGLTPRFAEKGKAIPNFELSFPRDEIEKTALRKSLKAEIGTSIIKVSPLELQIAYKLYLGSEKDWEDALHLYSLFEDRLDREELEYYSRELRVRGDLDKLRKA